MVSVIVCLQQSSWQVLPFQRKVLAVRNRLLVVLSFSVLCFPTHAAVPAQVTQCLTAHPEVHFNSSQKPSILKVHFRGQHPEYVVAVREKAGIRRGLAMVCGIGGSLVLGGPAQPPFSDMSSDAYMSSNWRVCRKAQIAEMRDWYKGVPDVPFEAVCLTWEDGEALIYWDGGRFRFKGFGENDYYPSSPAPASQPLAEGKATQ